LHYSGIFILKKNKRKFPLHYVLIAGLAGLLPDLDIAVYYILSFFGFTLQEIHRTFSHNIFIPLIFLLLGFLFIGVRNRELGKHKLKLSTIFFVISFGVVIHLILDALVSGVVFLFYPFSDYFVGLNLIRLLPVAWQQTIEPTMDAAILIFWIIYMEVRHN